MGMAGHAGKSAPCPHGNRSKAAERQALPVCSTHIGGTIDDRGYLHAGRFSARSCRTCEDPGIASRASRARILAITVRDIAGPASQGLGRVLEGRRFLVATESNINWAVAGMLAASPGFALIEGVHVCPRSDASTTSALAERGGRTAVLGPIRQAARSHGLTDLRRLVMDSTTASTGLLPETSGHLSGAAATPLTGARTGRCNFSPRH